MFSFTKKKINKSVQSKKKSSKRNISVNLNNNKLNKYRIKSNKDITKLKYWELPNRKHFYNWVSDNFSHYEINKSSTYKKYIPRIAEHFNLNNFQRTARDYLQDESPVRGILLYYGLGAGKTCTGITIAEAILSKKKVVVFSKTSLESNWLKEIRACGSDYVKNHNHWVFKSIDIDTLSNKKTYESSKSDFNIIDLINELGIPHQTIKTNGGIFLVDFTNSTSNFNNLTSEYRDMLDKQIDSMIDERFEFIHTDNPRIGLKLKPELLNNKIIIWDEVHNLGNVMVKTNSPNAKLYYDMFMNAENVKIMFLSGTPIINRIFEITKITI